MAYRRPSTLAAVRGPAEPDLDMATTEELLEPRDRLPAAHPARAALPDRAIEMKLPMARRLARRYGGRGAPTDRRTIRRLERNRHAGRDHPRPPTPMPSEKGSST
jgi:hypothetical protein